MARSTLNVAGSNRLLAPLQGREKARGLSSLEAIPGAAADVLFRGRTAISHVYFPTSGIVSLTLGLKGGRAVEIGMVGNEGSAKFHRAMGFQAHEDPAYAGPGRPRVVFTKAL